MLKHRLLPTRADRCLHKWIAHLLLLRIAHSRREHDVRAATSDRALGLAIRDQVLECWTHGLEAGAGAVAALGGQLAVGLLGRRLEEVFGEVFVALLNGGRLFSAHFSSILILHD